MDDRRFCFCDKDSFSPFPSDVFPRDVFPRDDDSGEYDQEDLGY